MPKILLIVAALLSTFPFTQTTKDAENKLPELNKIEKVTLGPAYGCRPRQEFRKGYQQTALFLSDPSIDRNSPDLLFNGACNSPDYFEGSTAGDDMSLIADLGEAPLESLPTQAAFYKNGKRVNGNSADFNNEAAIVQGHTYTLLINKADVRGLLVFTVVRYEHNKSVDMRYAVKEYQLLNVATQSKGFDWSATNRAEGACDCPK